MLSNQSSLIKWIRCPQNNILKQNTFLLLMHFGYYLVFIICQSEILLFGDVQFTWETKLEKTTGASLYWRRKVAIKVKRKMAVTVIEQEVKVLIWEGPKTHQLPGRIP